MFKKFTFIEIPSPSNVTLKSLCLFSPFFLPFIFNSLKTLLYGQRRSSCPSRQVLFSISDHYLCFTEITFNVALRIRPLTDRDRAQPRFANLANDDVLKVHDKTVQVVPHNKYFSFDHVFGSTSSQDDIFKTVGDNLIHKFVEGYNITILAYVRI